MADRLRGKVALITGAASGIGAATAALFAREGAAVALTDLKADSLEPTMAQVASSGAPAVVTAGDVTRRADAERLIDETLKRFGRVDVLVNSAGVSARNAPPDWDWKRVWDFVMAINMKGTFLMCKAIVDQRVKQGGGSIVNLSSIYGLVGRPRELGNGLDPYLHSKGGVAQLTRDMAVPLREGPRPGQRALPRLRVYAAHEGADGRPREPELSRGQASDGPARPACGDRGRGAVTLLVASAA